MRRYRPFVLILVAAFLPACSSGGDEDSGGINCAGLAGGTATSSVQCSAGQCTVDFQDAAADGDLGTFAIMDAAPNSAGSLSLRVTARDGVTYAAGTPAAVVYGIDRTGGDSLNTAVTLNTYLDGVLQESGNTELGNGVTNSDKATGRRARDTNLAFDAIELVYAQTGGTADVEVQVYEFCTSVN